MKCRVCDTPIEAFMSFGRMPIANGFLTSDQIKDEYFYELAPAVCGNCGMFQLMEQPDPNRMFHDQYAFHTGTSAAMDWHFGRWSETIPRDSSVIEIGCNDGTFLKHLNNRGIKCIGVEPSANVAKLAKRHGKVINSFFDTSLDIESADYILAANVICHIPDINALAKAVVAALKPNGHFVFEEPYLPDMLEKVSFDQLYDEHVFIFSAASVAHAFGCHGLYLVDCQHQITHGGSMRYTFSRQFSERMPIVNVFLKREEALGLSQPATYKQFKANCERRSRKLKRILGEVPGRIVGYGATSKSTTVLNYADIGPDDIEYISDTTPIKHGKLSPGKHIPIRPYEDFKANYPDYALLFAWNHAEEIMAKEQFPGKWINYIPRVSVQ